MINNTEGKRMNNDNEKQDLKNHRNECSSGLKKSNDELCEKMCGHKKNFEKHIDELLEALWELREQGKISETNLQETGKGRVILDNFDLLCQQSLIYKQDGHVKFTTGGEERARNIVRRHRLTERMLIDLFDIPEDRIEGTSCEFEHILSEEVTDSICTFLGHPVNCPHGHPIPRGECCISIARYIRPIVMPLIDLNIGEKGKIQFIATQDKHRLQRLSSLGIIPDNTLKINQKLPVLVIQVGETEIALEKDMVAEIYVKRSNEG
jgi:DtxR family transcriptional regulator, Mn-dependent transcriptional regulator